MTGLFRDPTFIAIFLGLIVIALAALGRYCRQRLLATLSSSMRRLPEPLRTAVRKNLDRRYPTWRAKAGELRNQASLESRLRKIREAKMHNFYILGAVYLDIFVRPVKTKNLVNTEYSDLQQVGDDSGGSACYVGRFLASPRFKKRSYLYTRLGGKGPFSDILKKHLKEETWIRRLRMTEDPDSQCGVSIHLFQPDDNYDTTFTCKGALASLGWNKSLEALRKDTRRGGILHISGYFRTNLCDDLARSLNQLPANLVTCIDHGRFEPEESQRAAKELLKAFSEGAVDIYICSYPELRNLMSGAGAFVEEGLPVNLALDVYAKKELLPRVVVVRCNPDKTRVTAWVLIDDKAFSVTREMPNVRQRSIELGTSNSFNAAIMHFLATGDPDENLNDALRNSVSGSLDVWKSYQ